MFFCAWAHHVEGDVSLFQTLALTPVGEAVRFGCTSSDSNKIIFPCLDGLFGDVGLMVFLRGILEACIVLGDECFHIM